MGQLVEQDGDRRGDQELEQAREGALPLRLCRQRERRLGGTRAGARPRAQESPPAIVDDLATDGPDVRAYAWAPERDPGGRQHIAALSARPRGPAGAATFEVTDTGDSGDTNTADGICTASGGGCTLRAAIQQANVTAAPAGHDRDFDVRRAPGRTRHRLRQRHGRGHEPGTIDGYSRHRRRAEQRALGVEWHPARSSSTATSSSGLVVSGGDTAIRGAGDPRRQGPRLGRLGPRSMTTSEGDGVLLKTSGNNHVEGNFVGDDGRGRVATRRRAQQARTASESCPETATPSAARRQRSATLFRATATTVTQATGPTSACRLSGGLRHRRWPATTSERDPAGTAPVPNAGRRRPRERPVLGITGIPAGPIGDTMIGGTAAGAGNLISGNGAYGGFVCVGRSRL